MSYDELKTLYQREINNLIMMEEREKEKNNNKN